MKRHFVIGIVLAGFLISPQSNAEWIKIIGHEELKAIFSGATIEYRWNGRTSIGNYCADGSSSLTTNGENKDRLWWVDGEEQICFKGLAEAFGVCYEVFKHKHNKAEYIAKVVPTQGEVPFTVLSIDPAEACDN